MSRKEAGEAEDAKEAKDEKRGPRRRGSFEERRTRCKRSKGSKRWNLFIICFLQNSPSFSLTHLIL